MNIIKYITGSVSRKIIFGMFSLFIFSGVIILSTIVTKISEDNINATNSNLEMFSVAIFQNLRNVMNSGDSELIKLAENDARNIEGVERLVVAKSQALIDLYNPKEFLTKDPATLEVLNTKQNKVLELYTGEQHSLRMLKPMLATNECLQCHVNQKNGDVIGVMDITFSLNPYDETLNDMIFSIVVISSILAIINISIILFIIRHATKPIEGLQHGFKRLLSSNESYDKIKLTARTNDEIGEVIMLFNQYMDKLNKEIKEDTTKFAEFVINSQTNLIVTSKDKKKINSVNKSFLNFFKITKKEDFFEKFGPCVCDGFDIDESGKYIQEYMNGKNWRDHINDNPHIVHKVKMQDHIFKININHFTYNKTDYFTSVFTDITELEETTLEIDRSHQKIQKLLDSVNQGFLYFDRDMIIGSEYSKNAEDIFSHITIKHQDITKLLYKDEEKQNFLKETLTFVFDQDEQKREIVLSLLDKEFIINGRNITVEYKILSNEICMIILTDVTDTLELNKQLEQEKQILKMIVEISTNTEQFLEVQDTYTVLSNNIDEYKSLEKLPFLRREVHTLKGLFAQKEMLHIVDHLHNFETLIDESVRNNAITTELQNIGSKTMTSWLEDDLAILRIILGQDFFTKVNFISVDKSRINKLKEFVKNQCLENQNCDTLTPLIGEIDKLRRHNIKTFLQPYVKLVEQIANKLNKSVKPLKIECDEIYIEDKYKDFLNSLVHIFRNSVDHGIEAQQIREERLKPIYGTITCKVIEMDNNITISICDDGNGIDLEKVKKLSVERDIYDISQIESISEQDILQVIFKDEFTTTENITTISGRGVGLSSVQNELKLLNGSMSIENKPQEGVTFKFTLPK